VNIARYLAPAAVVLATAGVAIVRADDVKDVKTQARAITGKVAKSVVTARIVLKVSLGGREREVKVETQGTVIDPSGLTIVSAATVDPGAGMMGGGGGRRGGRGGAGGGAGGGADMKIESEVTETTLILEDGTEVESDVVLKDNELDLAFIRPRDASAKLEAIALKPRGTPPALLDDVIVVGRLGRIANRASSVSVGQVKAVVKGPRTYYVCSDELAGSNVTGCVGYDVDGNTLGVFVTKMATGDESARGRGGAIVVLRSVEDVIEIANQAKTAKAPEKKKAEPADEKKDEKSKDADKAKDAPKDEKKPSAPKKDEDD
jgi:hypothetical protein